jgi:hypothetical protein
MKIKNTRIKKYKRNNNKAMRKYIRSLPSINMHRYIIWQHFIFDGVTYQEPNMSLNTVDTLWNIPLFLKYSELYQYLKIQSIKVDITAVQQAGQNPPAGFMVFVGNESLGVKYSDIPNLPYAKKIKPVGNTSVRYTRPGRNDDFNKWYNTQSNVELQRAEASIRFRFVNTFTANGAYYVVKIGYDIRFDKPFIYSSNRLDKGGKKEQQESEKVCTVKVGADSKPIIIDKDEEEFEKCWEEEINPYEGEPQEAEDIVKTVPNA